MTSRRLACAAAAACAASLLPVSAVESRVVRPDDTVHLSGCLVRMDNGNGYLLTNGPNDVSEPALAEGERYVAPGAAGTDDATIFYWLDDDDGLKVHVGHRVQIKGERKGDVKEGENRTGSQGQLDRADGEGRRPDRACASLQSAGGGSRQDRPQGPHPGEARRRRPREDGAGGLPMTPLTRPAATPPSTRVHVRERLMDAAPVLPIRGRG